MWAIVKLVMSLAGVHVEVAQAEVKRDAARLMTGAVLLVAAGLFVAFVLLGLHAAVIMALYEEARLTWYGAILATAGGDLALALLLALVGRARLRAPVLKETRGLVRATVSALREV